MFEGETGFEDDLRVSFWVWGLFSCNMLIHCPGFEGMGDGSQTSILPTFPNLWETPKSLEHQQVLHSSDQRFSTLTTSKTSTNINAVAPSSSKQLEQTKRSDRVEAEV